MTDKKLYGVVTDDGESFPYLAVFTFRWKKDRNFFLKQKIAQHKGKIKFTKYLPVTIIVEKGKLFNRNNKYERGNRNPQRVN